MFLYKNQDKSLLYPGLDYSYLFDVAARNVNDNVSYDNFINRFVLNNLPLRLLFLLFFRYNKKPPFRAVYYKRVFVIQNVIIIVKASCLTPFICFYVFSASCSEMVCAWLSLCYVKVFYLYVITLRRLKAFFMPIK